MKSQPLSICPIVCDKMEQKLSLAKWESSGDVLQPNDNTYHYWTVHLKIVETINFMLFFLSQLEKYGMGGSKKHFCDKSKSMD